MKSMPLSELSTRGDAVGKMVDLDDFDVDDSYIIRKDLNPFGRPLPEHVAAVPGMLSRVERQLLLTLTTNFYSGQGAIVDGGSFFGSSVCALAAGLQDNPKALERISHASELKPIVAYELGHLPKPGSLKDPRRVYGGQEYVMGESFVPILEKSIEPFTALIDLNIGDFLQQRWPPEREIEICFIDCAKTEQLNKHVCSELFPRFIPNKTFLVHQDFYFDRLPWIKLSMAYYNDFFQWVGQIGSSAVYQCVAPIAEDICQYDPYTMGGVDEKLELHRQCEAAYLPTKRRFMLAISYCYMLAICGKRDAALERLDEIEAEFPELVVPVGQMKVVRTERARKQITRDTIHHPLRDDPKRRRRQQRRRRGGLRARLMAMFRRFA